MRRGAKFHAELGLETQRGLEKCAAAFPAIPSRYGETRDKHRYPVESIANRSPFGAPRQKDAWERLIGLVIINSLHQRP